MREKAESAGDIRGKAGVMPRLRQCAGPDSHGGRALRGAGRNSCRVSNNFNRRRSPIAFQHRHRRTQIVITTGANSGHRP